MNWPSSSIDSLPSSVFPLMEVPSCWGGRVLPLLAVANTPTLPEQIRNRLGAHIRSCVIYESAPICFGLPMPSQNYSPLVVESIPPNKRLQAFAQWATGYFDHDASGNKFTLQTPHDPDTLEWVLHSSKIPTYYNIPTEELTQMTVYGDEASTDLPMLFFFQNEHKKALTAVLKDPDVASTFPNLKRAYITGDKAPAFGIAGMWAIQDEPGLMDAPIHFELVKGGNHFAMWDDPNMILNAVLRAAT
ncbi:hypothetical protein E1B28_004239 [Marasmius oreades]|uniref:Uncharacterized protein n=1 Tax=Marasmius oreades TaxID=181124 RepID=A0A9P7UYA7_9AGAR|nr:uncharacterized protein E1B28_004239 [Marasmius oreades]KAG7096830.1 hypothetical protein E1B28_004239 [Marasmius oreades]